MTTPAATASAPAARTAGALADPAPASDRLLRRPDRWHRPLLVLAAAMGVLAVVCVVLATTDPRELGGANLWFKPLKFALSTGIYAVTLAWMVGQVVRHRRLANVAATITVVGLTIEMLIIPGAAIAGTTSHFNVSSPLASALWTAMAISINVVWVMALLVGVLLFRNRLGGPARTLAIRAAVLFAVAGMGLAFLMVGPTPDQIRDFQGIAGAHTVGAPDGGAGLPVLGWSTVAGDLRIPHFIGMHGLQAIPLALIASELLARRVPVLRLERVRVRLVVIAIVGYAAATALVTWQALLGQSIVAPSGGVLVGGIALAVAVPAAAAALVVAAGARSMGRRN